MINYKPKPYLNWMPKYKKGQVVRVLATNKTTVVAGILPEQGGVYYILEDTKGAYHESEIESVS